MGEKFSFFFCVCIIASVGRASAVALPASHCAQGLSSHLISSSFVPPFFFIRPLSNELDDEVPLCMYSMPLYGRTEETRNINVFFLASCCTACETCDMLWCDIIAPRRWLTPKRSAKKDAESNKRQYKYSRSPLISYPLNSTLHSCITNCTSSILE